MWYDLDFQKLSYQNEMLFLLGFPIKKLAYLKNKCAFYNQFKKLYEIRYIIIRTNVI